MLETSILSSFWKFWRSLRKDGKEGIESDKHIELELPKRFESEEVSKRKNSFWDSFIVFGVNKIKKCLEEALNKIEKISLTQYKKKTT